MPTQAAMIDLIQKNPRFQKNEGCYVSIYRKEQLYGGPEEGGWWHTVYALEGSVSFVSREHAESYYDEIHSLAQKLQHDANMCRREAYLDDCARGIEFDDNDLCHGESIDETFFVHVEDEKGSMDNSKDGMPHYE